MSNLKYVVGLLFIVIVFTFAAHPVLAHHQQDVLGDATSSSQLNFPAVTSGPGYILPDSPLFFLDEIKQAIRVTLAVDAKQKIAVHKAIAGERLAELRIMVSKNNQEGVNTALFGISHEMGEAAKALSEAASSGKDVTKEATDLNDALKMQRNLLSNLINQSTGSLQLQFKGARKSLQESKVVAEDSLPENELWKEIDETLSTNVGENIDETGDLSKKLQADLDRLSSMASAAATRALTKRAEALDKAMDSKDPVEIAAQKKMLADEKAKQDKLLSAQKAYIQEARKAIADTMRAVDNLQNANTVVTQIKK